LVLARPQPATPRPPGPTTTDIPARLDRLPWSRFHWRMVVALGAAWALDGLEVTLAGTLAGALGNSPRLHLDSTELGLTASAYLVGAVLGALVLGYLADALGRRRLYIVTLGLYLLGAAASALSWSFASYAAARLLTGVGIGGEYSAINSAIQEFTPARLRGRVDILVNGSFWIGAILSAAAAGIVQIPGLLPADLGWRLAFGLGAALGFGVLRLRRYVPESPRWLILHGRLPEAERIVAGIEADIGPAALRASSRAPLWTIELGAMQAVTLVSAVRTLVTAYRRRTLLGLALMTAQAFCYNAIFFSYALILVHFYDVPADAAGWYLIPFAFGNFCGPLLLGRLFDTIGRRPMIVATYAVSGLLLALTGMSFRLGLLDATLQVMMWSVTFFVASAAASAAYLTVSESFPLEMRALVIALFYAFGTLLGGVAGPAVFGALIAVGSRQGILVGYLLGGGLMIGAALVELAIGVAGEGRSLESLAPPLSSVPSGSSPTDATRHPPDSNH
jgi:MFS family permease